MTAQELASVVRTLPQVQKLVVYEERLFKAANKCMDLFEDTGSFQALDKAVRATYCDLRVMRDNIRFHADNIPSADI